MVAVIMPTVTAMTMVSAMTFVSGMPPRRLFMALMSFGLFLHLRRG